MTETHPFGPMPQLTMVPGACPKCGATDFDGAAKLCRPSSDETGESYCQSIEDEFRFPTATSLAELDEWCGRAGNWEERHAIDPLLTSVGPAALISGLGRHGFLELDEPWPIGLGWSDWTDPGSDAMRISETSLNSSTKIADPWPHAPLVKWINGVPQI